MSTRSVSEPGMDASGEVSMAIERWLADGTITAEQANQMREAVALSPAPGTTSPAASAPGASRTALVTEALGYLGGVIILVALGLVVGGLWDKLQLGAQLALLAVVAAMFVVAGALIPVRLGATGARLRAALWLASSAALAASLGLGVTEWSALSGEAVAMCAAWGVAFYSALLWRVHRHLLQHFAVFVALVVAVGTGASLLPDSRALPGLAMWGIATAWFALAWGGVIPGRQAGTVLGAAGMAVFASSLVDNGWGVAVALATICGLIAVSLVFRELVLLGIASVGTLVVLPPIMDRYFPGTLTPALVLLCVGVLLVFAAVAMTRRRNDAAPGGEPRWVAGTRRAGAQLAAVVLVVTTSVVLVAGMG